MPSRRRRLQAASNLDRGVDIRLKKRIPVQGGLGGGSSDAATTLVALNEIWGLRLAPSLLAELGLELGADIPFFILGQTAWGEGVGERLTPLELPERHFAVVFPGVGIRTADVFQAPELTRKTPETTIRGFLKAGGHNDCEPVVTGRSPEVRRALAWLAERGKRADDGHRQLRVRVVRRSRAAHAALEGLPPGWRGFVARGLDRSPLQERLAAERSRGSGRIWIGVSPSGKATGFDPVIRRFESFHPSQMKRGRAARHGERIAWTSPRWRCSRATRIRRSRRTSRGT